MQFSRFSSILAAFFFLSLEAMAEFNIKDWATEFDKKILVAKLDSEKVKEEDISKADTDKPSDDRFAERDKVRKKDGYPSLVLVNQMSEETANNIAAINNQVLKRVVNYSVEPLYSADAAGIQSTILDRLDKFKDAKAASKKLIKLALDIEKLGLSNTKDFDCTDENLRDDSKFQFNRKDNFSIKKLLMNYGSHSAEEASAARDFFEGIFPNLAKAEVCNQAAASCFFKRNTELLKVVENSLNDLEKQLIAEHKELSGPLLSSAYMLDIRMALVPLYVGEYEIMCRNFRLRSELEMAIVRKRIERNLDKVNMIVDSLCKGRSQEIRYILVGMCTVFQSELLLSKNIQKALPQLNQ